MDSRQTIRDYVLRTALPGEAATNLRDDTRLCSSGILDSLAALEMFTFLEQEFGIRITEYDRATAGCDSIDEIASLIAAKLHSPVARLH